MVRYYCGGFESWIEEFKKDTFLSAAKRLQGIHALIFRKTCANRFCHSKLFSCTTFNPTGGFEHSQQTSKSISRHGSVF